MKKYRFEKITVKGQPRYRVQERKGADWNNVSILDTETGEVTDKLTIGQLIGICGTNVKDKAILKDIEHYLDSFELRKQDETYQIIRQTTKNSTKSTIVLSKADEIGGLSDGYHTFNELYDFRREYNAALVNTGTWPAYKSHKHHDGELCFGGGWFIVVIQTPFGQISNHYQDEYWDEFHCEELEVAPEWDGHTEKDVLERLKKCNRNDNI